VWFALYHPHEERRLRLRLPDFAVVTQAAGHRWRHCDLTGAFARWMAEQEYRESYFESPADMALALKVRPLLEVALSHGQHHNDPTAAVFGSAAKAVARAAEFLAGGYRLVCTNVPYLAQRKQGDTLRSHLERYYYSARIDLATAFLIRCLALCTGGGSTALVTPQNWLFLGSYEPLRRGLLRDSTFNAVAKLGTGAFDGIGGSVVNVCLSIFTNVRPTEDLVFAGIDVSAASGAEEKALGLRCSVPQIVTQAGQLDNPECRIGLDEPASHPLLERYTITPQGIKTGDDERFRRCFWELPNVVGGWEFYQSTVSCSQPYGGRHFVTDWRSGGEGMAATVAVRQTPRRNASRCRRSSAPGMCAVTHS
jgi:hypothetical protein